MGRDTLLFVVSAPSGAGKTSLCKEVINLVPGLDFSISYTARPSRQHEVNGVDYHFVSLEEFQKMIDSGQMLEWTEIYGNFYGTSKASVEECRSKGMDIIFDIDHLGARRIKEAYPDSVTIFILPPSHDELKERLTQRATDTEEVIKMRHEKAREEMKESSWYCYQIVNDQFEKAVAQLKEIITAERKKKKDSECPVL